MASSRQPRALLGAALAVVGCALVGLKLWLVSSQGRIVWGSAKNDDFSYLLRAAHITGGDWLGDFTHLTLHTGAGYPIWIALNSLHPLPLYLADHLFYALACAIFALALKPRLGPVVGLALFAALLFNPGSHDLQMRRIMRSAIYYSQTLLVVGTMLGIYVRARGRIGRLSIWAFGFGVSLGFFWITREEGVWLLPSVALLAAGLLYDLRRQPAVRAGPRLALLGASAALSVLIVLAVAATNYRHYGVFTTTEMKLTEFRRAVGAIQRVEHASRLPYLPVPAEVMERVAAHSPSFRDIAPHLGDARLHYKKARQALGVQNDPRYATEIPGGWFLWAFRNAASRAGHYESLPEARAFWGRLADEIDAACASGALACGRRSAAVAPPWRADRLGPMARSALRGVVYLATMDGLRLGSAPSDGRRRQLEMARRVTGDRLEPTARVAARMAAGEEGGDPSERPERRLAALGTIAAAYRTLVPWCALLALGTWLAIVSVRRLRRGSELALIGGCLLLAIAVRLALLAYIDVTSFNGISYRYLAPLYPLLIAFVVLTAREAGRRIAATSEGAGDA